MTNSDVKIFMLFIGYSFVKVGYYGSEDETEFQTTEQEWMNNVGIDSVGEYFILKESDEFYHMYNSNWSTLIDFENNWNWLMKVAVKAGLKQISTDIKEAYNQCRNVVFS